MYFKESLVCQRSAAMMYDGKFDVDVIWLDVSSRFFAVEKYNIFSIENFTFELYNISAKIVIWYMALNVLYCKCIYFLVKIIILRIKFQNTL